MKIRKNSLWNTIFHKGTLRKQYEEYNRNKMLIVLASTYVERIRKSKSLIEVLGYHKDAWKKGFKCSSIGPNKYGMFRTKKIETMTPDEVFLGNIYGLLTKPLPDWERYRHVPYGGNSFLIDPETPIYDLVMKQYQGHLMSNIRFLESLARQYNEDYERINR